MDHITIVTNKWVEHTLEQFGGGDSDIPHLSSINIEDLRQHIRKAVTTSKFQGGKASNNNDVDVETIATALGNLQTKHPQYGVLATRLLMADLYMKTPGRFAEAAEILYSKGIMNESTYKASVEHDDRIAEALKQRLNADFIHISLQGFYHLTKSYLLSYKDEKTGRRVVVERPRYMAMRVGLGLWPDNIEMALKTFYAMCDGTLTHASPTLFNAGTTVNQLASCFIQTVDGTDEMTMAQGLVDSAAISKMNGGVGACFDGDDCAGYSVVLDKLLKLVPQGGKENMKRPGAGAMYSQVWEANYTKFLASKRADGGPEDERAKDLFPASWIDDVFMERLIKCLKTGKDQPWTLFSGEKAKLLRNLHGREFKQVYESLEDELVWEEADALAARDGKKMAAIQLQKTTVNKICREMSATLFETGCPYQMFKDVVNSRTNHSNRGTIPCANLCTEIVEYCDKDETAVCILASINLKKFFTPSTKVYDFDALGKIVRLAVRNLNRTLDMTVFPTERARKSVENMRSIGLGIRNLAGLFVSAGLPFISLKAKQLMTAISAHMYKVGLDESAEIAKEKGESYKYFEGSDYSKGIFQHDYPFTSDLDDPDACWRSTIQCGICKRKPTDRGEEEECCSTIVRYKMVDVTPTWQQVREKVMKHGTANSQITAYMPTVGTAQIWGHQESFEPLKSLIYVASVNSGEFQTVNPDMVDYLEPLGLWTEDTKNAIINNGGDMEGLDFIPAKIRNIFMTGWNMPQKELIRMAAMRAQYVDQSQSLNLFVKKPTLSLLMNLLVFARRCGNVKTPSYYTRTKSATSSQKLTTGGDPVLAKKVLMCTRSNMADCIPCSS